MSTAHRPNLSPRAGTAVSSSAAGPSSDIFRLLPEPNTEFGASKLQKVKSLLDFPWCRTCQLAKKASQPIPRIQIPSLIIAISATPMKKHCHGPKTKPSMVPNEISARTWRKLYELSTKVLKMLSWRFLRFQKKLFLPWKIFGSSEKRSNYNSEKVE